jgi:hypothetical protein
MDSSRRGSPYTVVAVLLFGCLVACDVTQAQVPRGKVPRTHTAREVHKVRSRNFLVHTDLPLDQANSLVAQLERMLDSIATYWGRPMRGVIECYVVRDIDTFPIAGMDAVGIRAIKTVGGMNVMRTAWDGKRYLAKSIVYADDRPEVVLHEVVHAYCHHSFGRIGPVWYAEGMAEMGHYWIEGDTTVHAEHRETEYVRRSRRKTLAEATSPHQVSGDSWQNYASRWALCHFLTHAPNYSSRFSLFGRSLLMGRDVTFEQMYGAVAPQLAFEYEFYLRHIAPGYCVHRTAWDWNTRFATLRTGHTMNATIAAGRGWQPSGLTVKNGTRYQYASNGVCSIAKSIEKVDADGDAQGRGRLVGALLDNYQLGAEFELGTEGSFKASSNGNLYLRCRNAWNELPADSGQFSLGIQLQRQSPRR